MRLRDNELLRRIASVVLVSLNVVMSVFLGWKLFDFILIKLFDLIVDKLNNIRQRRRDRSRHDPLMASLTSDNSEFGRKGSLNVEGVFKNRMSLNNKKPKEDFSI